MAKKTRGGRNRAENEAGSYMRSLTNRSEESGWFADPSLNGLVTSQVEDMTLVNQRRSQFVHTAIELFSRNGYFATTVKEIADTAKVSPGLIYQYVTDKEEILFLALQLIVHTNKQVIPAAISRLSDPVHRFVAAFDAYCRVFDANRSACLLTYRETKSLRDDHRDAIKNMEIETNELIAVCVRECIKAGYFRKTNVDLFIYQAVMAAHGWALKHWRLKDMVSLDEYISFTIDSLLRAVLTEEGWSHYRDHVQNAKLPSAIAAEAPIRQAKPRRRAKA